MKRICYMSRGRNTLSPSDREDILQCSLRNNNRDGITGLLVCDGSRFLQALEGEDRFIDDCWSRISRDDRHYDTVVFENAAIERREFGNWALNCHSQLMIDVSQFRSLVIRDVAGVSDPKLKAMFIGFAALAR
jgi:hypothetical protein